jgi:hypothetical protein
MIQLTKSELLDILKKAYMRGMYEHSHQQYRNPGTSAKLYPEISIPDHIIEDLIKE